MNKNSTTIYVGYKPQRKSKAWHKHLLLRVTKPFEENRDAFDPTLYSKIVTLHETPTVQAYQDIYNCLKKYRLGNPLWEFFEYAQIIESTYVKNLHNEWSAYYARPLFILHGEINTLKAMINRSHDGLTEKRLIKLKKLELRYRKISAALKIHDNGFRVFEGGQ